MNYPNLIYQAVLDKTTLATTDIICIDSNNRRCSLSNVLFIDESKSVQFNIYTTQQLKKSLYSIFYSLTQHPENFPEYLNKYYRNVLSTIDGLDHSEVENYLQTSMLIQ
jgi:hypothetical protein